jgi:hypothetical protein
MLAMVSLFFARSSQGNTKATKELLENGDTPEKMIILIIIFIL